MGQERHSLFLRVTGGSEKLQSGGRVKACLCYFWVSTSDNHVLHVLHIFNTVKTLKTYFLNQLHTMSNGSLHKHPLLVFHFHSGFTSVSHENEIEEPGTIMKTFIIY